MLQPEEQVKAEAFELRHYYWCRVPEGLFSPGQHAGFTYHMHETGIGCNVKVECCQCRESEDVTDYDSW